MSAAKDYQSCTTYASAAVIQSKHQYYHLETLLKPLKVASTIYTWMWKLLYSFPTALHVATQITCI